MSTSGDMLQNSPCAAQHCISGTLKSPFLHKCHTSAVLDCYEGSDPCRQRAHLQRLDGLAVSGGPSQDPEAILRSTVGDKPGRSRFGTAVDPWAAADDLDKDCKAARHSGHSNNYIWNVCGQRPPPLFAADLNMLLSNILFHVIHTPIPWL